MFYRCPFLTPRTLSRTDDRRPVKTLSVLDLIGQKELTETFNLPILLFYGDQKVRNLALRRSGFETEQHIGYLKQTWDAMIGFL